MLALGRLGRTRALVGVRSLTATGTTGTVSTWAGRSTPANLAGVSRVKELTLVGWVV